MNTIGLKKRQRLILKALESLGGSATTREIANAVNLNVNGVSQSLGAPKDVQCLGGKAGETRWELHNPNRSTVSKGEDNE